MATWATLDATTLPFIEPATDALNALDPVLGAASTAANVAQTSLLKLSAVAKTLPDPIEALRTLINDLINDLVGTGIFTLVVKPDLRNRSGFTGVDGFGRLLKAAFNDGGDLNRPKFDIGDTSEGIVFLIAAPSFQELSDLAEGLQVLFGGSWQELIDFVNHAENVIPHAVVESSGVVTGFPVGADPKKQFQDTTKGTTSNPSFDPFAGQRLSMLTGRNANLSARIDAYDGSTQTYTMKPPFRYDIEAGDAYTVSYITTPSPPDWQSLRTVDVVPVVAEVTEVLASLRDILPATGQQAFLNNLSALLTQKAELFSLLQSQIQDVIDLFDRLGQVPSVSMLTVGGQDLGNDGFVREFFDANNPPVVGKGDFTLGVVLYGGSGVLDTLSKVFPI
jgi:hypothetical protein